MKNPFLNIRNFPSANNGPQTAIRSAFGFILSGLRIFLLRLFFFFFQIIVSIVRTSRVRRFVCIFFFWSEIFFLRLIRLFSARVTGLYTRRRHGSRYTQTNRTRPFVSFACLLFT